MSDEYAHGRRDGLRLALAVLAAEEAKWSALLGESSSWRTNQTREVRHKTLQVAQKAVTTFKRFSPGDGTTGAELAQQSVEPALASSGDYHAPFANDIQSRQVGLPTVSATARSLQRQSQTRPSSSARSSNTSRPA